MEQSMKRTLLPIGNTILLEGITNANDLLSALREEMDPNHKTFLQDSKWDHLAAHYSNLDLKQIIFAFGQELSSHNLALYSKKKDNGKFSIVPVNGDHRAVFEEKAQSEEKIINICLQEGKHFGEPAYRFDTIADRLPSEIYNLESPDSYYIGFVGKQLFTKSPGNRPYEYSYYYLDLNSWPPKKTYFSKPIINVTFNSIHKLYAALELDTENHFYIKRIRIGHDLSDLCSWDFIDLQEEIGGTHAFRWVELAWIKNDLLLLDENHLWCVKDAAIGGRTFTHVSEINSCGCSLNCSPTVIRTGNGGTFIPSNKKLWQWKDGELTNTGITITKLYGKRFSTASLGKADFITTTRKGRIVVHTQTDTGSIRFLDLVDSPSLSSVKNLGTDWIVFFNNETYTEPDSDLAQFWNHKTNEWLRMKFGMLDTSTVHNMSMNEEGTAFIADNQGKLHAIEAFFDKLRACNSNEDKEMMKSNKWYDGRGNRKAPPSYLLPKVCQASQAKSALSFEERLEYFGKMKLTETKNKNVQKK